MIVGVLAVSLSGPMMAAMLVPPLALAFWRNAMAAAVIIPAAALGRRDEIRGLSPRRLALVLVSGLALAVHFAAWVTALTLTSVASATAIVCLQLAWVALWQLVHGERFGIQAVVGLVLALVGVVVVSGVDLTLSADAIRGDGLALVGGMAAAAYTVLGSRARQSLSTTSYTAICYSTCALVLLLGALATGQDLHGYPVRQWVLLVLVTVTAQLLGHSVFNHLLATTAPIVVSLALLLEVPGAALLAAWFLHQRPPVGVVLGLVVLMAGMACVVLADHDEPVDAMVEAPVD